MNLIRRLFHQLARIQGAQSLLTWLFSIAMAVWTFSQGIKYSEPRTMTLLAAAGVFAFLIYAGKETFSLIGRFRLTGKLLPESAEILVKKPGKDVETSFVVTVKNMDDRPLFLSVLESSHSISGRTSKASTSIDLDAQLIPLGSQQIYLPPIIADETMSDGQGEVMLRIGYGREKGDQAHIMKCQYLVTLPSRLHAGTDGLMVSKGLPSRLVALEYSYARILG